MPNHSFLGTFTSNGIKIYYSDQGSGDPVVLIHGYLADMKSQWIDPGVMKALLDTGKYRVIMLDNRGHGQSDKPLGPQNYGAEMAEDVARLTQELKTPRVHVIGYSMGSWIAQKMAADHPGLVHTLTAGGAGWLQQGDNSPLVLIVNALDDVAAGGSQGKEVLRRILPPTAQVPSQEQAKPLGDAGRGVMGLALTEKQAKAYTGPILGLIAERDWLTPEMDALQDFYPRMKRVTIKDADHVTAFEKSEFKDAVKAFLADNPITG